MAETTTIEVKIETWKQLHFRKELGESFDDVIQDLLTATIKEEEPGKEPTLVEYSEAEPGQQCANYIPDRGGCDNEADYELTMEYDGNLTTVPYCEKHANVDSEGGR